MPSAEVRTIARWIIRGDRNGRTPQPVRAVTSTPSWRMWLAAKELYREKVPESQRTRQQAARIAEIERKKTEFDCRRY